MIVRDQYAGRHVTERFRPIGCSRRASAKRHGARRSRNDGPAQRASSRNRV